MTNQVRYQRKIVPFNLFEKIKLKIGGFFLKIGDLLKGSSESKSNVSLFPGYEALAKDWLSKEDEEAWAYLEEYRKN